MTAQQIQTFYEIATCNVASVGNSWTSQVKFGTAKSKDTLYKMQIVNAYIKQIAGFDPAIPMCLTQLQVKNIMQRISWWLGLCINFESLPSDLCFLLTGDETGYILLENGDKIIINC